MGGPSSRRLRIAVCASTLVSLTPPAGAAPAPRRAPIVESAFIFETAPFPSCHASTIAELPSGGLIAGWFGGKDEGDPSVGIWIARRGSEGWSRPIEVAKEPSVPCWNPVLFVDRAKTLWLYYKAGTSPQTWSGLRKRSTNEGKTWSEAEVLPAGLLGPVRSKPIYLADGTLLAGTSFESYRVWTGWVDRSEDDGRTWSRHGPLAVPGVNEGLIQPTLVEVRPGVVRTFLRSTRRIGAVCAATSTDGGRTWSPASATSLPNPNAGIEAVALADGRVLLVYNHTRSGRSPLNVAVSRDGGASWDPPLVLEDEPGEYSYPAAIQGRDGRIHIAYTWRRLRIKHVVLDPKGL
ncbi:MAG: exo-alpha-sialidase [Planctomycetes bacterium]|nr:exo-alpha-sialidase [Planctomycetota bacterium]